MPYPLLSLHHYYLLNLLLSSLLAYGVTQSTCARELPPIVDIYQAALSAPEIKKLRDVLAALEVQLEKAYAEIEEKARLIESLEKESTFRLPWIFTWGKKKRALHCSDVLAERDWQKTMQLLQANQYTEAIDVLTVFMQRYPQHPREASGYYFLGQLYFLKGDLAYALDCFKRFIEKYPKDARIPEAQFHAGLVYYAQKDNVMAYKMFTQIMQRYPDHAIAKQAEAQLTHLNLDEVA